ncbi:ribonuclease H-like domain-containing protein [Tanacetum coccineum]
MTDYSLWEVILNGNKVLKRTVGEVEQEYEPTSAEEKQDRRNEMKARGTLLMALPNKDQLKFHSYKDAKLLMEAIEKRYGRNKESKKVQKTLLKQQYENFAGLSSETMDQTFDRSLPSEWKTHALIWRNKEEIETISLDDLYNNLKIYEPELTGSTNTNQNSQNVAFVSSNSTNSNSNSSTNEADNTTYGVSVAHTQSNPTSRDNLSDAVICAFLASQPNSPQLSREDLEQIDLDDLEEMDLQWEMAMLTIRVRRFIKRTCRKLDVNGQKVGFDWSKVECYNCHKNGHFARECRAPRNQENIGRENSRRTVTVETPTEDALVSQDRIGGYDWSCQVEEEHPTNYALMAYTSSGSSSSSDSEVDSCSKSCLELVEARLAHYKKNEVVFEESINVLNLEVKLRDNALVENKKKLEKVEKREMASPAVESFVNSSEMLENQEYNKSKSDKGYHAVPPPYTGNFIPSKPDLTFMDEIVESENMDVITVVTPSNVKKVESNHESADVKNNGDAIEPKTVRKNSFRPPVIKDWNSDDDSEVEFIPNVKDKTVRPSTEKIKFVKSARETVEKVETPKQNKHYPRGNQRNWNNLMSQRLGSDFKMINKACFVCGSFEHLYYKICPQAVLTRSGKINTTGASVNTVVRPVNTAGSKTTVNHPRPISNAYKKGYSQVTRPFNKYSANKNSIFNKKVNTVRVKYTTTRDRVVVSENKEKEVNAVKASACWGNPQQKEYKEKGVIDSGCSRHMTGNKCYLTEYEDYDGGFVSFGDGKGRISRKGKIKTGTLDFDNVYFCKELKYNLFSVSQICDKKNNVLFTDIECLILSSDFKLLDESQVLLRVPRKHNIYSVDLKSVVPTKGLTFLFDKTTIDESNLWHRRIGHINFKNMNKLVRGNHVRGLPSKIFENDHSCVACQKGKQHKASCIKREFSVARTPQQNGVTERRNRTLIKATRTMLVDSKFPTTFWAEVVNTACYVLNRVLVIKPHTKKPYELIRGRTPLIDFMKPFGCPVTILNTKDHLGKFDGKADEGFFLLGNGPDWLFDVDSLIISMNYVPVVAGNQTNDIVGRDNIVAGQAEKKTEPEQEYILIPFCITNPLISQGPKDSEEYVGMKPTEVNESGASKGKENEQDTISEFERLLQQEKQTNSTNSFNTVGTPVSAARPSFTNDDPSSPVNAAKASNAFEDHLFE